MHYKNISLFYGSLDPYRSFTLFIYWLFSFLYSENKSLKKLSRVVTSELGDVEVFPFSSARGGLTTLLQSLDIKKGDKVLVSGFTCLAVPTAVVAAGANPIYIDIDKTDLSPDPKQMILKMNSDVKAVIIQHTMGNIADTDSIIKEAKKYNICVIEDCALSIGSKKKNTAIGSNADAAIFSMELSKTISTGWGGILTVKNKKLVENLNHYYQKLPTQSSISTFKDISQILISSILLSRFIYFFGKYIYSLAHKIKFFRLSTPEIESKGIVGKNFILRMSKPQILFAALQWRRLKKIRDIYSPKIKELTKLISSLGFTVFDKNNDKCQIVTPRICFLVDDPSKTQAWFASNGVEIGRWFDSPISPLPENEIFNYDPMKLPNALKISDHIVNLPSHVGINSKDFNKLSLLLRKYSELNSN